MKIQVFGSGCASCKKLYALVQKVVAEEKMAAEVEYVTDIQRLLDLGVMQAPVLAIDGHPVTVGFLPNEEQIKKLIKDSKKCCCNNC